MCYVAAIPLITLALSAAATAYTVDSSNKAVKAENKGREISAESARESFRQQSSQVNLGIQQEQEKATNAKIQNAMRAAEARSTARTASGQAGVAGMSVDNLMADFYRQEGTFRAVTDSNLASTVEQSQRELQGLKSQSMSRENSLRPAPVPGYLGAGLRIAGDGVQAYDSYKRNSDPNYAPRG